MATEDLDIIASRILTSDGGSEILVELARPEPTGFATEHKCVIRITNAQTSRTTKAYGVDAFQALQLAFVMIGAVLARIESDQGISLSFSDGDMGFPRP